MVKLLVSKVRVYPNIWSKNYSFCFFHNQTNTQEQKQLKFLRIPLAVTWEDALGSSCSGGSPAQRWRMRRCCLQAGCPRGAQGVFGSELVPLGGTWAWNQGQRWWWFILKDFPPVELVHWNTDYLFSLVWKYIKKIFAWEKTKKQCWERTWVVTKEWYGTQRRNIN